MISSESLTNSLARNRTWAPNRAAPAGPGWFTGGPATTKPAPVWQGQGLGGRQPRKAPTTGPSAGAGCSMQQAWGSRLERICQPPARRARRALACDPRQAAFGNTPWQSYPRRREYRAAIADSTHPIRRRPDHADACANRAVAGGAPARQLGRSPNGAVTRESPRMRIVGPFWPPPSTRAGRYSGMVPVLQALDAKRST
jgi:hypothetical protein